MTSASASPSWSAANSSGTGRSISWTCTRGRKAARCEDSIGCMHGSSEPDLRNWKSPTPQFTQGAR
ncbi:hypothetical protein, partial [Bordetella pertussis]